LTTSSGATERSFYLIFVRTFRINSFGQQFLAHSKVRPRKGPDWLKRLLRRGPLANGLQDTDTYLQRACNDRVRTFGEFWVDCSTLRQFFFLLLVALSRLANAAPTYAQENPYIVAYDHNLEEPGNLEIEYFSTVGTQRDGPNYHAYWMSSSME
jgi:hypothetical protein